MAARRNKIVTLFLPFERTYILSTYHPYFIFLFNMRNGWVKKDAKSLSSTQGISSDFPTLFDGYFFAMILELGYINLRYLNLNYFIKMDFKLRIYSYNAEKILFRLL